MINVIDWMVFVLFSIYVLYLLFYSVASHFYHQAVYPKSQITNRIAVLFPAYKEDSVIINSVSRFLKQEYPSDMYDIIVISDNMEEQTNQSLLELAITLIIVDYDNSSKAKALKTAINKIDASKYDIVVIMDGDNTTEYNFLSKINNIYNSGAKAIQARRTGYKSSSDIALLDNLSEEINNGIFRRGHNAVKLPSALSGSGMAFDAKWFIENVNQLNSTGEDKELEALLIQQNVYIHFINDLCVYDEKTTKVNAISNQRKRWMAVQLYSLKLVIADLPVAMTTGNIAYCDKIIQWTLPPRLIQIGAIFACTIIALLFGDIDDGLKWVILFVAQLIALLLPIPCRYYSMKLLKSLMINGLYLFLITIRNIFKLKGADKIFIHTEHGKQK